METRSVIVAAAAVMAFGCVGAIGQGSSGKPVRLLVPSPAGGPTDFAARLVAPRLSEALGQNVVVDNRGSANGIVGTEIAARAAPDGLTLIMGNSGTHAINAGLYRKLPYDPQRDFVAITEVLASGMVLVANPRLAAGSLKDFIALAKKESGKLNIGVAGATGQLAGEALKAQTQITLNNVHYKGSSPTEFAVLQGEVEVTLLTPIASAAHVNAGKLKALGVTSAKRMALLPNVPTIAESGVTGYDFQIWHGLFAPAGTPDKIVRALYQQVARTLSAPEVRERVNAQGFEIVANTPEEFAALVKREIEKYRKLISAAGIALE
ncbi:MAG TPA: tripartite tricarboxylate transporter substrate binding protein [Burkholderiales bacterium]|nr:tripartite tricarboxylate transporter substrate binding protein [Burkholderiales bacterium]